MTHDNKSLLKRLGLIGSASVIALAALSFTVAHASSGESHDGSSHESSSHESTSHDSDSDHSGTDSDHDGADTHADVSGDTESCGTGDDPACQ